MRHLSLGLFFLLLCVALAFAGAQSRLQNHIKPPAAVAVSKTVVDPVDTVTVTVTLSGTSQGQNVSISSDDSVAGAAMPTTLWFPANAGQATFTFTVPEDTGESFEIRAASAGVTVASSKIYLR